MTDQERDAILLSLRDDLRDVKQRLGGVETAVTETLPRQIEDLDAKVDAVDARVRNLEAKVSDLEAKGDAVRGELEILGRETREGWAVLQRELPPAVVAAVDRAFGTELRNLQAEVDQLKRAG